MALDLFRAIIALALLGGIAGVAIWRASRKVRGDFLPRLARIPAAALTPSGAPLTAYYFTSRLCGACKDTAGIVRDAAPEVPAIAWPVEQHAALARALGIAETPTLFLVDEEGRIRYARAGNPDPTELWTYVREAWDSLDAEGGLPRRAFSAN